MPKLLAFNSVTVDGYFTDAAGDMSWAHGNDDPEFNAFVAGNASGNGVLLFGRKTYEMMVSFWPTPQAKQSMPAVAEGMNKARKVVFSRTLDNVTWNNTTLVKDDLAGAVRKMKAEPGDGMTILGSGSIIAQLAAEGLIDEYQFVLIPIALGKGRTMFDGMPRRLPLTLTSSRAFPGGKVVLTYRA